MRRLGLVYCFWLVVAVAAAAAEPPQFETDIRPLLKTHCFHCHGERGVVEGNLDLRLRRFLVKGGDSGAAIVPENERESLLLQRVTDGEMPPGDDKKLSADEIAVIAAWIRDGAPTVTTEPEQLSGDYFTPQERNWWAFQPVQRPQMPPSTPLGTTPIDALVLAQLKANTTPAADFAPQADRVTLIRRLYLDMLGVPPTPEQVDRFVGDRRPGAWERLIERVLASPLYGERWARHWLDAAGYADSEGYTEEDPVRANAFQYRDYVIRAFNTNKSYADFLIEQLAGDELVGYPQSGFREEFAETLAATGFLRMAPDGTASGGGDQNLARNQMVADTLQIVGTSMLGITLHCAQCHDHRYDPIPQRNYYEMRAIFEPAFDWKNWRAPNDRRVSLYTEAEKKTRADIEARAQEVDQQRQERVDYYIDKTLEHELLMVAAELREPLRQAFKTPAAERTDEQKKLLDEHTNVGKITAGSLYLYDRRRDARAKDLDQKKAQLLDIALNQLREKTLAELPEDVRDAAQAALKLAEDQRNEAAKTLLQSHPALTATEETLGQFNAQAAAEIERYTTAAAEIRKFQIRTELQEFTDEAKKIRDTIPTEYFLRITSEIPDKVPATFVFHRGDHDQPQEEVQPRGLAILDGPLLDKDDAESLATSGRRLAFARHLTSGDHPLVARAFVNRLWGHHFGRGIVSTKGDFGYLGQRPTHPQLLDWLASEFVDSGWDIKHMHRLILTSRVYRQSAVASESAVQADPENRWLGRWPLRRLESEVVRDAMLAVAGRLSHKMYGVPVPVMEDEVGQIILGIENLDGERKPTNPIPLHGEQYRRSIYVQVRRSRPLGVMESFDIPDLAPNCPDRPSSTVATQSLMMMNSDFAIQMADDMAQRLQAAHPDDLSAQVQLAWRLTMGSQPSDQQRKRSLEFVARQTAAFQAADVDKTPANAALSTYCQALLGSNAFLYIE